MKPIQNVMKVMFCILFFNSYAQEVTFQNLDSLQKEEARYTIIFLKTDWCKYCHMMEEQTLSDSAVNQFLNEKFYFISFDAESKDDIEFLGETFSYIPNGDRTGIHQLAKELATVDGKVTYPTLVFLDKDFSIMYQHVGVVETGELLEVLRKLLKN